MRVFFPNQAEITNLFFFVFSKEYPKRLNNVHALLDKEIAHNRNQQDGKYEKGRKKDRNK
jgi:hypothetical protein